MVHYLKTAWFGVILYDDNGVINQQLFPRDAEAIANRLEAIEGGDIIQEERFFTTHKPIVDDRRLEELYTYCDTIPPLPVTPENMGFNSSLLHEASIQLAERQVKEQRSQRKRRIAQAIHAVDDLLKTANLLSERATEWYNYFADYPVNHKKAIQEVQEWAIGGTSYLDRQEENALKQLGAMVSSIFLTQNIVEAYVRDTMHKLAPNVSELVGESIAARLIAVAGGLDRLAELPSGTIQVLGAEKALFRHIKEGTPPPKHGIIFQHESINRAPRKLRGKIARALAANIAIAARADVFTGRAIAEQLKNNFEKRVREILG